MHLGRGLVALALAACHGGAAGATLPLRDACGAGQHWDGRACRPRGEAAALIARGKEALSRDADVEAAKAALDAAEQGGGPRDHESNILLWQQRGIAAAYVDDDAAAAAAFDMLLALDPSHILSYRLSTKATFVFEDVRRRLERKAPSVDVRWRLGQKVGEPIPLDLEVVADPKRFLQRATLFVRVRGEERWRAADVALSAAARDRQARVELPAVQLQRPASLELYLRAYDERGNEVLAWADPKQPREIPLRYDPPPPWYRKPWVWITGGSVVVVATAAIVYALAVAPPDRVPGSVTVK